MKTLLLRIWPVLPLVWCAGCDQAEAPAAEPAANAETVVEPAADPTMGFEVWHEDFPFPIHRSAPALAPRYTRTRRQALEQIVANLRGNCSRDAWNFAKAFFRRCDEEAIPALIEAVDRGMQTRHLADVVQNTVEAMGGLGRFESEELASSIVRAAQHGKAAVRNAALAAMVGAGTPDSIRRIREFLDSLEPRAQADWLRAVRRHLPAPEAGEILHQALYSDAGSAMFAVALQEIVALPPELAAELLRPMWRDSHSKLKLAIASVLHQIGDPLGTQHLLDTLRGEEPGLKVGAMQALAGGDLEHVEDTILALSMDRDATVRQSVTMVIRDQPGENITNVLAALAMDRDPQVRQPALQALRLRGSRDHLDRLIERIKTESGTKLLQTLADVSAAGDGQAVPAILARYETAPKEEQRKFIQALGRSGAPEALPALEKMFLQPESVIDHRGVQTNVTYVGVLLPNFAENRPQVLELYHRLPREDYRRRAVVLHALANIASLASEEDFVADVYEVLRGVLHDRTECPQMRLISLEWLRRDLSLDDAMDVKRMLDDEDPPMRRALNNFLFEFF